MQYEFREAGDCMVILHAPAMGYTTLTPIHQEYPACG